MAKKTIKKFDPKKPSLFKVGHHLIDITDISVISMVKRNLYIIKTKSNPEPEFAIWANNAEVQPLLKKFNIENADGTDRYARGEDRPKGAFNLDGPDIEEDPDFDDPGIWDDK